MLLNSNLISGVRMKINKEELIQLIADKTEMEKEDITTQLEQLIQRIVDAAQRGKALEIKEFGLFYFDDNGDLKFEPSTEFSTEINYKYAGMEPLELKSARDTSVPPEEVPEETDEPGDEDDPFSDFDQKPAAFEDDPFAGLLGDDSFSDEGETVSDPVPLKPGKKSSEKTARSYKSTRKKNPIMTIIITILTFVLLAAGYFIFIEFFQSSPPQASVAAAEPDDNEQVEEMRRVEPEEIIEVSETEQKNAEPPAETKPAYGLTGEVTDRGNDDGYSIVVYSFNIEYQAREAAFELNREGDYRVLVTTRTIRGNKVWRVSLGQFPSIEEAQQQAKTLPAPYNTENFIQRIQIN